MRETLKDLTGAPCITIFTKDGTPDSHWTTIVDADLNKHIMGCASSDLKKSGDDSADATTGLSGNHAYTLISVLEIVTREGELRVRQPHEFSDPTNIRLLKLRNPWGKGEWTGDWSDRSPLWTPRLRAEANIVDKDDGIFFMPFDLWLGYFRDYQICYYHDNYQYSSKLFTSVPGEYKFISFELSTPGNYYFTANQPNKRLFKKGESYVYSPLAMFVGLFNHQGGVTYIGSICKADKEMWFKAACQPGVYCAMIYTPWVGGVNEFSFSTYGPQATNIVEISAGQAPPNFLHDIIISKALKEPETLKSYQELNQPSIYYKFESGSDSIGYFYFLNHTYDTDLEVAVTFTKFTDSEVLPPYSQASPKIAVPAGEQGLLMYRLNGPKAKVSFKTAATFKKGSPAQSHDQYDQSSSFPKSPDKRRGAPPEGSAYPWSSAEVFAPITPEQIKAQGQWVAKNDQYGNSYNIYSYLLEHDHGSSLFYENNTDEFILDEDITFDLRDCKIEGISGSAAKVRVGPRQSSLINIIRTGPSFSAQVTYCTYQIYRA
jgi:Calpain family cysteine protease